MPGPDAPPQPLDDVIGTTDKAATTLEDILRGGHRLPPGMPTVDGKFHNGHDLNGPPDGDAKTLNGTPDPGGITLELDDQIEFLHFGTTYLDQRSAFEHALLDDTDPKADLVNTKGARGLLYRAALERETILLASFVDAHVDALKERDADEGALGSALSMVGNLLGGGGGSSDKPDPADLNPFVSDIKAAGAKIDVIEFAYDVGHQAAIDLHTVRASYAEYVKQQVEKAKSKPKEGGGLLSQLPGIGNLIPPELGNVFTLVEKMSTKAFEIHVGMVVKLTQVMMPVIEQAARDASIEAITQRRVPAFDVWHPPPPPEKKHLITPPSAPPGTGISAIDKLVGGVMGTIAGVASDVNKVADPAIDFLNKPGDPAPGGKFLDRIFLQVDDGSGYLGQIGKQSIGDEVCASFCESFGFDMPDFVKAIITRTCNVHADFIRGVYGVLVSADPADAIREADLVEAGRVHLVSQLIEALVGGIGFLHTVRQFNPKINIQGADRGISGEALYQRAKEFVEHDLAKHIDPIVEKLMKDFASNLESSRQTAENANAVTMEIYLGQLPTLHALLFRKTFFPIWDLLVNTVFSPVSGAIGALGGKVGGIAQKASAIVDTVGTDLLRAEKVAQTLLTKGLAVQGLATNLNQYADAMKSTLTALPGSGAATVVDKPFPFKARQSQGKGKHIEDTVFEAVRDKKQWQDDGGLDAGGDAAADAANPSAQQAAPVPA